MNLQTRTIVYLLLSLFTTACQQSNAPIFSTGVGVFLQDGSHVEVTQDPTLGFINIAIRSRSDDVRFKTASGLIFMQGMPKTALPSLVDAGNARKGDISASFAICREVQPGENIRVTYLLKDARGEGLETGKATVTIRRSSCSSGL